MLAEIYLLKLEAAVRAAKEAATTPQLGGTPRIQNNSGLPQGPATGSVVG